MTQPSKQEVKVAIDALRHEGAVWADLSAQVNGLSGIAHALVLSSFDFSALGHASGLADIYLELQQRITALLEQASANFDTTAGALKTAADAYEGEENRNTHEITGTY